MNNIFNQMVVAMFSMFVFCDVLLKILCPSVGSIGSEFFIHLNHNDNKYFTGWTYTDLSLASCLIC